MISITYTIIAFLLAIGILVTVHEFGHYWVAQRLGIKILRFSIGFGHPLWIRRFGKDETEFAISAIPLGGYVKMLDSNETDQDISPADLPRAFNHQPLKVRIPVVLAGPLFNILFAILAYTAMFMIGITGRPPIIGEVIPDGPADRAGLRSGYEIVAVDGQPTVLWESVRQATLPKLLDQELLTYSVRDREGRRYDLTLDLTHLSIDEVGQRAFSDMLGIELFPAIAGNITPNSAAERAGLRSGDKIIALEDKPIYSWEAWADYVANHPEQEIKVTVLREETRLTLYLKPNRVNGNGLAGVRLADRYLSTAIEQYSLGSALWQGVNKTWEISVLTLRVIGKMLVLQVSPKNISGPITIAEIAGKTAQIGIVAFLSFLGLVSVSLAVLNLLPIPILDGGHLLLYLLEWIKGSPLSETTQLLLQRIGLTILFGLTGLAIFNDLGRLID